MEPEDNLEQCGSKTPTSKEPRSVTRAVGASHIVIDIPGTQTLDLRGLVERFGVDRVLPRRFKSNPCSDPIYKP